MDKPYFLWDYDLTENDVHRIINSNNETERIWILSRIFESANFKDVWKYISVKDAVNVFSDLKLRPVIKEAWQNAFHAWGYQV